MDKLTEKQKRIFDFINESFLQSGRAPTVRETAARFNVNIGAAQKHIAALIHKGFVMHTPGISRGLDPVFRKSQVPVRILGKVTAGTPVEAIEDTEGYLHIDADIAKNGQHFALRVKGDSMSGAGILEGDIVGVRQQQAGDDGDIVVALVDGEATVKKLRRKDGEVYLEPANPRYKPIRSKDIRIIGKVVYLSRKI